MANFPKYVLLVESRTNTEVLLIRNGVGFDNELEAKREASRVATEEQRAVYIGKLEPAYRVTPMTLTEPLT